MCNQNALLSYMHTHCKFFSRPNYHKLIPLKSFMCNQIALLSNAF